MVHFSERKKKILTRILPQEKKQELLIFSVAVSGLVGHRWDASVKMATLWAAGGSGVVTQGDRSSLGVPSGRVGVTVCVVVGDGVSAGGNAGDGVVGNV